MTIEPIGVATFLCGLYVLWFGPASGMLPFVVSSLLGAAAAVKLPALGDASITPGHIVLVFVMLSVAVRQNYRDQALRSVCVPSAGLVLLLGTVYGVFTAVFLPRIFAGLTDVYSLARSTDGVPRIVVTSLAPRASNITQSVYLLANLVCFAVTVAFIRVNGADRILQILILMVMVNLAFVVFDVATFMSGTAWLLEFIRNANYGILEDGEIAGLKRIVGSFTEASSYAYFSGGMFAFCARLWLGGVKGEISGKLGIVLLGTLVLSTSTTAYASLVVVAAFLLLGCLLRLLRGEASRRDAMCLAMVPPLVIAILMAAMLVPSVWSVVLEAWDRTVIGKLDSQSGVERSRWNAQALQSFFDTAGLGAGVGSVRASSYVVALLANVGGIGAVLALVFVVTIFQRSHRENHDVGGRVIVQAASAGCVAMMVSAAISGTGTDLGLLFFIYAALALSGGQTSPVPTETLNVRIRHRLLARRPETAALRSGS